MKNTAALIALGGGAYGTLECPRLVTATGDAMKPLSVSEKRALLWVLSLGLGAFLTMRVQDYLDRYQIEWAVKCVTEHHQTTFREVQGCIEQLYETPTYHLLRGLSFGALFILLPLLVQHLADKHIRS